MDYFPIMLDLRGKKCLVVGAGRVGQRKITRLLKGNPKKVLVIDPYLKQETRNLLETDPRVEALQREFIPEDLHNCFLVIASSSDQDINRQISILCQEKNILCNIADQPEKCNFILPALHQQGPLMLCISTSGASPALAKKIRIKLARQFGPEYGLWLEFLRQMRPKIISLGLGPELNRQFFALLTAEEVLDYIQKKDGSGLLYYFQQAMEQQDNLRLLQKQCLSILREAINDFFQLP